MILIAVLILTVFCVLVWHTYVKYNYQEQPKLIDISSRHGVFVARNEQEAADVIKSKSAKASDGDVCYVRYSENGTVKTIAGIYSVTEGKVSITYLK